MVYLKEKSFHSKEGELVFPLNEEICIVQEFPTVLRVVSVMVNEGINILLFSS